MSNPVQGAGTLALLLAKSASPTTYSSVGTTINYSYVLTNLGTGTLNAPFAVSDDKATVTCPPTPTSLGTGQTITCTASYSITQTDLDAGAVTNLATATAKDISNQTVTSNQDSKTVTAAQNPRLALTKTADPTSYDHVGQVISYTLVATNDGNVTLNGVSITDPALGALSCTPAQPATLAPCNRSPAPPPTPSPRPT